MNITVCHSHHERCGVREYGAQLDRSFVFLGMNVKTCTYDNIGEGVGQMDSKSIFMVHFEPGLVTPWYLNQYLDAARDRGAKTVMCCHWYEYEYMRQYEGHFDQLVLHREYERKATRSTVIPLGCPIYVPGSSTRNEIRSKFGIPVDATVMTTIGFLNRWKAIPKLAKSMLDAVALFGDANLHVHIHAPWPYEADDAKIEEARVREVMTAHSCKKISLSTDFLSEKETLDLAWASDLGFVYHSFHTHSVSAATKQFVSTRRPLIVTESNHASDLRGGVVQASGGDVSAFARSVVAVAMDEVRLPDLQREVEREYIRLNMMAVASQYAFLFEKLLWPPV